MINSIINIERFINDVVHGMVNLPNYIAEIVDTKHFQRLRSINQMGFTKFVYPTTTNTRFEHCVGTFHLASNLIHQLQKQAVDEKLVEISDDTKSLINDDEVRCVEIAALCHDLGHGPYSHVWELTIKRVLKDKCVNKPHEDLSCEIFKMLINTIKSGEQETIKEKIHLSDEMVDLICRLILGEYDKTKDKNKKFLFEIIANKDSGLDVDKFDYLCRDIIHLGWSNTNKIKDIWRIIHFFRVVKSGDEYRLATRDREIFQIYDIFYSRHLLHRYGYQHKTTKAIECMFTNAMETIITNHLDELIISVIGENQMKEILKKMSCKEAILCSKEFISKVCDYHIWNIIDKHVPDCINKIHERKVHKLFCKLQIEAKEERFYKELFDIVCKLELKICKMLIPSEQEKRLIQISLTKFSLASESGDPIFKIPFYKKVSNKECFIFDETNQPSGLVNLIKSEHIVMIFIDPELRQNSDLMKKLNEIKTGLCEDCDEDDSNNFEEVKTKFRFKESNY